MALTNDDISKIQQAVRTTVRDEVQTELKGLRQDFATLQTAVDGFLQGLGAYHQEFVVYKAQQDRLRHALVRKGILTEKELAV